MTEKILHNLFFWLFSRTWATNFNTQSCCVITPVLTKFHTFPVEIFAQSKSDNVLTIGSAGAWDAWLERRGSNKMENKRGMNGKRTCLFRPWMGVNIQVQLKNVCKRIKVSKGTGFCPSLMKKKKEQMSGSCLHPFHFYFVFWWKEQQDYQPDNKRI